MTPWERMNRVGPVSCCYDGPTSSAVVVKVYGMDGRFWLEARVSPDLVAPALMFMAFQRPPLCLN